MNDIMNQLDMNVVSENDEMEMPTYFLYRNTAPGQPYDPTAAPVFFPPKDSDELFDALRAKYPHLKTHSERMRDAVIDFLMEERLAEGPEPQIANEQDSWQSTFTSASPSFDAAISEPTSLAPNMSWQSTLASASPTTYDSPISTSVDTPSFPNSPRTTTRPSSTGTSPASLENMTSVFSLSTTEQPKQRQRRKMTDAEKAEYRKRRIIKACEKCAKRKRKCTHNQEDAASIELRLNADRVSKSSTSTNTIKSTLRRHELAEKVTTNRSIFSATTGFDLEEFADIGKELSFEDVLQSHNDVGFDLANWYDGTHYDDLTISSTPSLQRSDSSFSSSSLSSPYVPGPKQLIIPPTPNPHVPGAERLPTTTPLHDQLTSHGFIAPSSLAIGPMHRPPFPGWLNSGGEVRHGLSTQAERPDNRQHQNAVTECDIIEGTISSGLQRMQSDTGSVNARSTTHGQGLPTVLFSAQGLTRSSSPSIDLFMTRRRISDVAPTTWKDLHGSGHAPQLGLGQINGAQDGNATQGLVTVKPRSGCGEDSSTRSVHANTTLFCNGDPVAPASGILKVSYPEAAEKVQDSGRKMDHFWVRDHHGRSSTSYASFLPTAFGLLCYAMVCTTALLSAPTVALLAILVSATSGSQSQGARTIRRLGKLSPELLSSCPIRWQI